MFKLQKRSSLESRIALIDEEILKQLERLYPKDGTPNPVDVVSLKAYIGELYRARRQLHQKLVLSCSERAKLFFERNILTPAALVIFLLFGMLVVSSIVQITSRQNLATKLDILESGVLSENNQIVSADTDKRPIGFVSITDKSLGAAIDPSNARWNTQGSKLSAIKAIRQRLDLFIDVGDPDNKLIFQAIRRDYELVTNPDNVGIQYLLAATADHRKTILEENTFFESRAEERAFRKDLNEELTELLSSLVDSTTMLDLLVHEPVSASEVGKPDGWSVDGIWRRIIQFLRDSTLSSEYLLAIVVTCSGVLGSFSAAFRDSNRKLLQPLMLGTATGIITFLAIMGGKDIFLQEMNGGSFLLNPYSSALAGLVAGIFTERSFGLLSDLFDKATDNIRGAFGAKGSGIAPTAEPSRNRETDTSALAQAIVEAMHKIELPEDPAEDLE